MANKKRKFLTIISCLSLFSIFIFIISGYVSAQALKDNKNNIAPDKVSTIKIPPPIEGNTPSSAKSAQNLKKIDIAIQSANGEIHKYNVELAITLEQQRIGMMFREYIDENTGMLFSFENESERSFWMKDTLIPLDILFIRKDGVITHIHHMAEENSTNRINSNGKVIAVLEIAGGEAEILGINIGDRILYKDF